MVAHLRARSRAEPRRFAPPASTPRTSTCGGSRRSSRPRTAYNIPITNRNPGYDGLVNTADDPGTTVTYWEYAASLAGLANSSTRIIPADGKQTFKTIEVAGNRRLNRRMADGGVVSPRRRPTPSSRTSRPTIRTPRSTPTTRRGKPRRSCRGAIRFPGRSSCRRPTSAAAAQPQASNYQFSGGTDDPHDRAEHRAGRHHQPPSDAICGTCASRSGCALERAVDRGALRLLQHLQRELRHVAKHARRARAIWCPSGIILPRILQMGVTYEF